MRWFFVSWMLIATAYAAEPGFKDIYGSIVAGCTVAADLDEGGGGDLNRIGPLTKDKLYDVFCYTSTYTGLACKVKQGGSTVDASSGEGSDGEAELLMAGEKTSVFVTSGMDYISFEPLADGVSTQFGVACRRN